MPVEPKHEKGLIKNTGYSNRFPGAYSVLLVLASGFVVVGGATHADKALPVKIGIPTRRRN